MRNPRLARQLAEYAKYHQHPTNVLCHVVGIPLIIFHVVAMLDWVHLFTIAGQTVTLAMLAYLPVVAWYFSLDKKLALLMALCFGICFPLGWLAPKSLVIGIAVFAWVLQLAGHAIWEKRSPAFLTNLLQLLVGPLYLADKLRTRLFGDKK